MPEAERDLDLNPAAVAPAGWRIHGTLPRSFISPLYKLGLVCVALAMIALPITYIALIAATAYAVYRHAIDPWFPIQGTGLIALLQYAGPLIAGVILLFFMIKPLFSRRARAKEGTRITGADEPELFRFIEAICDLVRAPRPRRVLIDMQVNASASFRRGLLSFFGRDLTLTIGLPLVTGLTVRQFGGVLAHEFGHFAQGAGMRLTFVVRSVNAWFARVVHERDKWDERLNDASRRTDFRLRVVLLLARGMVWVTRWILWGLMWLGHAISCFMLRQMEFDADRFETRVAGSDAFAATMRRIQELGIAWQRTIALQEETLLAKRLVDDLPGFVARETMRLPIDLRSFVDALIANSKTGWFDTHASPGERIAASRALAREGVLSGEAPATALFQDFATTARKRTAAYYEDDCCIELQEISIDAIERMAAEADAAAEEESCAAKWFGRLLTIRTLLTLTSDEVAAANASFASAEVHAAQLQTAVPIIEKMLKADAQELAAQNARALIDAVFIIEKKTFGLKAPTRDAAEEMIRDARRRMNEARADLDPLLSSTRYRLAHALRCHIASQTNCAVEATTLSELLAGFEPIKDSLASLRTQVAALELLLINSERATNASAWNVVAREATEGTEHSIAEVLKAIGHFSYPFPHAHGPITVTDFIDEPQTVADHIPRAFVRGRAVLNRTLALYNRVTRRLAVLAERAESGETVS